MPMQTDDVVVERKAIRSLRLVVRPDGRVVCRVPLFTPESVVEQFLMAHRDWLEKARGKMQERLEKKAAIRYESGETHLLWGKKMRLEVEEERGRESVAFYDDMIVLYAHPDRTPEQRKALLYQGYRQQFVPVFQEAFERWCDRLGEHGISVTLRLMRSEWGSCTKSKRRMTFNIDLVRFDPLCMEYVIVHEMTHLVHANHSAVFWRLCDERLAEVGMQESRWYKKMLRG